MKFSKTIEVFKKITTNTTSKVVEMGGVQFSVTEKQFEWLARTYITEANGWDTRFGATVKDEEGAQYAFAYYDYMFNVPRYIPNREKYGKKYFITYYKPK